MAKKPEKSAQNMNEASSSLEEIRQDLKEVNGKLLETGGVMYSFIQGLETSGFREYVDYLGKPWRAFWFNFSIGVARGLGFVIGATVVVAIVVWIISQVLTQLPIVGDFFETLKEFLSEENLKNIQSGNASDVLSRMFEAFKANVIESQSTSLPQ